jgi:hypothetical protein
VIRLGGPDSRSIEFLEGFNSGLLLHPDIKDGVDNLVLQQSLVDKYFINGAALFGRETDDEIDEIREGPLTSKSRQDLYDLIQYFVQRVRNYKSMSHRKYAQQEILDFRLFICDVDVD